MTQRTARWLVQWAPIVYLASMVLPTRLDASRSIQGYQLAVLCVLGTLDGSPLCIIGFAGNALFLVSGVMLLVRLLRGRPRPSFGAIFKVAAAAAVAMAAAWLWIEALDASREQWNWFNPGGWAWVASAVMLATGAWRLRVDVPPHGPRGFEVVPVARRADEPAARHAPP